MAELEIKKLSSEDNSIEVYFNKDTKDEVLIYIQDSLESAAISLTKSEVERVIEALSDANSKMKG